MTSGGGRQGTLFRDTTCNAWSAPAMKTKQGSPPQAIEAKNLARRGGKEPTILNTRTVEPPNRIEIDPLRVLVWAAFTLLLISAWAGIVWALADFA